MKNKPEASFYPKDGSGLITLYWTEGPYGLGTEPEEGFGVGFFDSERRILGVQFFDVEEKSDNQTLLFENGFSVSVKIKNGKVVDIKTTPAKKVA